MTLQEVLAARNGLEAEKKIIQYCDYLVTAMNHEDYMNFGNITAENPAKKAFKDVEEED